MLNITAKGTFWTAVEAIRLDKLALKLKTFFFVCVFEANLGRLDVLMVRISASQFWSFEVSARLRPSCVEFACSPQAGMDFSWYSGHILKTCMIDSLKTKLSIGENSSPKVKVLSKFHYFQTLSCHHYEVHYITDFQAGWCGTLKRCERSSDLNLPEMFAKYLFIYVSMPVTCRDR